MTTNDTGGSMQTKPTTTTCCKCGMAVNVASTHALACPSWGDKR